MPDDTRPLEERLRELQSVVTRLYVAWDAQHSIGLESVIKGEVPDFGPWMDTVNCRARVVGIRTSPRGEFQFATLKLEGPCTGYNGSEPNWADGLLFDLRNPAWESEFKRAQTASLPVGLRVDKDGRVVGLEVGSRAS